MADVAAVVVMLCSIAATGAYVYSRLGMRGVQTFRTRFISNALQERQKGTLLWGEHHPAEIVVFSDFQCPACRELQKSLSKLHEEIPTVAVRFRHWPITSIHPFAMTAAVASECAGRQGKFALMHDALFGNQELIGRDDWAAFGRRAHVPDTSAFRECLSDSLLIVAVQSSIRENEKLRIPATPTFIVGDSLYVGSRSAEELALLVRATGQNED
jgi:protein-disulfide isomerase